MISLMVFKVDEMIDNGVINIKYSTYGLISLVKQIVVIVDDK